MDLGIAGKHVLIPGSSSGIGLAVARALGGEGANVVLAARRRETVEAEAARLPSAVGLEVDLTADGAPEDLVRRAEEAFGPVDVLVLNSGGPPPGGAADMSAEQAAAAVNQLLLQHIRLTSLVLPACAAEAGDGSSPWDPPGCSSRCPTWRCPTWPVPDWPGI